MATLTATPITRAGVLDAPASAAVGGDALTNTGSEFLKYTNGSVSSITITIAFGPGGVIDGQTATNRTVTVAAGATQFIGPFPPNEYNDVNGRVVLTYSGVTSLTVTPLMLTPETN
jgi:hypothetical protein